MITVGHGRTVTALVEDLGTTDLTVRGLAEGAPGQSSAPQTPALDVSSAVRRGASEPPGQSPSD